MKRLTERTERMIAQTLTETVEEVNTCHGGNGTIEGATSQQFEFYLRHPEHLLKILPERARLLAVGRAGDHAGEYLLQYHPQIRTVIEDTARAAYAA